jgi:hypothetical protein
VIAVQEPEPELSHQLAPLDNLAIQPAGPARVEAVTLSPTPVPVRISSPAIAPAAAPTRAERGLQQAGLTPGGEISFHAAAICQSQLLDPAEPLPSRRQSVAFVRAQLPSADHSGLAIADLTQVDDARLKPVVPYQNGQPKNTISALLNSVPSAPAFVSSRIQFAGDSLAELVNALKTSSEELERAAIHAIQASFCEQPALFLLSAPAEVVTAPAPLGPWQRSPKPQFTPIAPENAARARAIAGPQAPTLAGPSLPPQLLNFEPQNSGLRPKRKRTSTWPLSLLISTVVILGAGSLLHYAMQYRDTKADSVEAPAQHTKAVVSHQVPVVVEHPAARSVEVAGVRIVTGPNKKPQLQYIVINHSASELTGLNVRIAVRSVEALADTPLFSVSILVPSLGPNQSKEIRTDLDSSIQPSDIPDWQSLRTEVLVARQ